MIRKLASIRQCAALQAQAKREGLVLRSTARKISFKAISNDFLEDED